ncbi:bacitracin ABC transporter ATP-binding protein [Clostridium botulinum C/D str. BKT12695]|nr:bacitracin ABC transporter ATP-binding protein [Clostridium botulinum C/D str. BKT12695]
MEENKMSEVLRVSNVSKIYRKQKVLNDINISIEKGEIIGLVGPNGAGKTTLMKIITGLIPRYEGDVFINEDNIKSKKRHETKQIGCVIETPGFYPDLTGYENLLFFAEVSGLKDKREIDKIIKRLGIKDYVHKKAKKYSLGMRQRLGLAQAVLSYPPILMLDEPTNGLDPAIVPELRKFIKYMAKEKNTSVLISSHILSEIELMCDKVVFIQKGNILKVENLNKQSDEFITVAFKSSKIEELKKFFNNNKVDFKIMDKDTVKIKIKDDKLENLTLEISENKIPLKGVSEIKESLEDKYLKTMGDN